MNWNLNITLLNPIYQDDVEVEIVVLKQKAF